MNGPIELSGAWKFRDAGEFRKLPAFKNGSWLPAKVPGDVRLDLMAAGKIGDPVVGANSLDQEWIERKSWWYAREFEAPRIAPSQRAELTFEGLDHDAIIYLNSRKLGTSRNAHVEHVFDVTRLLRVGRNELMVRLNSGVLRAEKKPLKRYCAALPKGARIHLRKPQFTFGWDWAPRVVTCGIWRPVRIVLHDQATIRSVHFRSRLNRDCSHAQALIEVEVEAFSRSLDDARVTVVLRRGAQEISASKRMPLAAGKCASCCLRLPVNRPALWWPRTEGEPNLYDLDVSLSRAGTILARRCDKVGIRKVEIVEDPLPGGAGFYLRINGRKVFCQGGNWVPADSIPARVTQEKYDRLLAETENLNYNMLRVWGGGMYENPCFYRLCDEKGIMLFHDFMFACAMYPDDDPAFMASVKDEADKVLRRLRNRPSIVLWTGGNEFEEGWPDCWHKYTDRFYIEKISKGILPAAVRKLDPDRVYRSCCPTGGRHPRSEFAGDTHENTPMATANEVADYRTYAGNIARFASEFLYMTSCPSMETLRECLGSADLRRDSRAWLHHTNVEFNNINPPLRMFYKDVETLPLEEYIEASQVLHGETVKFIYDHYRRRMAECGGALLWMFNDCWGTVGWTPVDYYLRRKALYYYIKRALAPVSLVFREEEGGLSVWIVNTSRTPVVGKLYAGRYTWKGVPVAEEKPLKVAVAAGASQQVARVFTGLGYLWDQIGSFYHAKLTSGGSTLLEGRHLFTSFRGLACVDRSMPAHYYKDIVLPQARLTMVVRRLDAARYEITVASDVLALAVKLSLPEWAAPEDNHFDIFPRTSKTVRVKVAGGKRLIGKDVTAEAFNRYISWAGPVPPV